MNRLPLTRIGSLLGSATVVGVLCGTALFVSSVMDDLPEGDYPPVLFLLPILAGGVLFFAIMSMILGRLGVPVFHKPESKDRRAEGGLSAPGRNL